MGSCLEEYLDLAVKHYPSLSRFTDLKSRMAPIISGQKLQLPKHVLAQAQQAVRKIHEFSRSPSQLAHLQATLAPGENEIVTANIQNQSVLMAYDFHYIKETDRLTLIEINTNASAYLIADLIYKLPQFEWTGPLPNPIQSLQSSFLSEAASIPNFEQPHVAIIDEKVSLQKMLPEFYMYQDLFHSWGWNAMICEYDDPFVFDANLVYNRYTDFTLKLPNSADLRRAFLNNEIVLSPNPREYLLLADKSRLIDFYQNKVSGTLLEIEVINPDSPKEQLWDNRKKLFFKPRSSFGSKATYRGASISRSYFDKLFTGGFIAQEHSPPGEINGWKFDLRFYAYQNEIQHTIARLYQGQVTNFSKLGGGFAPIQWC